MNNQDFAIGNIITSAWQHMKGGKWPMWAVMLVSAFSIMLMYYLTAVTLNLIGLPLNQASPAFYSTVSISLQIVSPFLWSTLMTGALMIALKKIRGEKINTLSGFQYLRQWWKLGISILLLYLGTFCINFIFGFLFSLSQHSNAPQLAYVFFWLRLVAIIVFLLFFIFNTVSLTDKNLGPIAAFSYSASIVRPYWLKLLGMWFTVALILLATSLPAYLTEFSHLTVIRSLGLLTTALLAVWTIPYILFITSNAYHQLSDP